jgi:hypothetical protein
MHYRKTAGIFLAAATSVAPIPLCAWDAKADTLPPYSFGTAPNNSNINASASSMGNGTNSSSQNVTTVGTTPPVQETNGAYSASVQASITATPLPTISVSGNASGPGGFNGAASAAAAIFFTYYVEFTGPTNQVSVGITATGMGTGSGVQAELDIPGVLDQALNNGAGTWSLNDQTYLFQTNTVYAVTLSAAGEASAPFAGGSESSLQVLIRYLFCPMDMRSS